MSGYARTGTEVTASKEPGPIRSAGRPASRRLLDRYRRIELLRELLAGRSVREACGTEDRNDGLWIGSERVFGLLAYRHRLD